MRLLTYGVLVVVGVLVGYSLRPDSGVHLLARSGDEWAAFATVLATGVALWFGAREDRARSDEITRLTGERDEARQQGQADRDAAALERRRHQATEVVVWATKHAVHSGGRWVPELTVGFANASLWPISTAHLVLRYPDGRSELGAVAMVVEAGASSPPFTFHAENMDDLPGADGIVLQFADGAGVHWSKSAKGALVEITDHPGLQGQQKPGHVFRFIGRQERVPF